MHALLIAELTSRLTCCMHYSYITAPLRSNKSNECDGDDIAFRFVRERYEPDGNMKEFFISSHDTHMVPVESAGAEETTERTH